MSDTTPDTAMMSGSDAGEPGEHLAPQPLTSDDEALLGRLQQPAPEVVAAVEDGPATESAVEDDTTLALPTPGGPADDGLAPPFHEPED